MQSKKKVNMDEQQESLDKEKKEELQEIEREEILQGTFQR